MPCNLKMELKSILTKSFCNLQVKCLTFCVKDKPRSKIVNNTDLLQHSESKQTISGWTKTMATDWLEKVSMFH